MKIGLLVAMLAGAALQAPTSAPETAPAQASQDASKTGLTETLGFEDDPSERMTVPVSIGGQGGFRFLVDTGAERTIISRELAEQLGLRHSGNVILHSTTDVRQVQTVSLPELALGRRLVRGVQAPTLRRSDLGAEGLIGVDSLDQAMVHFDFVRQQLTISPASQLTRQAVPPGTIVVTARKRHGRLIVADASVEGHPVRVIIDTGAQVSIGNEALRRRLLPERTQRKSHRVRVLSVTGGTMDADLVQTRNIKVGRLEITQLPIAFAGAAIFQHLDLTDRPALLLGMDVLSLFEEISIDFARRRVQFTGIREPRGNLATSTRLAEAGGSPRPLR